MVTRSDRGTSEAISTVGDTVRCRQLCRCSLAKGVGVMPASRWNDQQAQQTRIRLLMTASFGVNLVRVRCEWTVSEWDYSSTRSATALQQSELPSLDLVLIRVG